MTSSGPGGGRDVTASPFTGSGRASAAAFLAGIIWLLTALHHTWAHGATDVNEMHLVLGMTWMDTAKALPVALLLLVPGLEVLRRSAGIPRGPGDTGPLRPSPRRAVGMLLRLSEVGFVVAAVGGAIDYWPFPFGSYVETFESRGDALPVQFLASIVTTVVLLVLAVVRWRSRAGLAATQEPAVYGVLALGALTSSLWGPALFWPALAWAVFGAWLWWSVPGSAGGNRSV